jgi:hypothetical protein
MPLFLIFTRNARFKLEQVLSYFIKFFKSLFQVTTTMACTANYHPRAARGMVRATRSSKALATANRDDAKAAKVPAPSRDMHLTVLQRIVEVLMDRRGRMLETRGNTGRGLLTLIISEHIHHLPWLTSHVVNHYIATHPDGESIGTVIQTKSNNQTVVSGLTDSSPIARAMYDDEIVMELLPAPSDMSTTATEATDLTSIRGGRPQGSTDGVINAQKALVSEALDECAIEIAILKCTTEDQAHILGKKCRVPPGSYEKAVAKVCQKYNLEMSDISMETVLSRTKVGRKLKVNHRGTYSPMIGIEAHLLAAILRRATLHQPVSCGEGLELANYMIEGTEYQVAFIEWKKNNLKNGPQNETFGTLGQRYWKMFCRRNTDVITSKKAVRFGSKRDDWWHLENCGDMYDGVYDKLVQSGVAEKLDHVVWRDIENNIFNTEAEAHGRQTGYSLAHPDKLVFFDEVGKNIP